MPPKDKDTTTVDLERNEVALIIGDDDGEMSVRVASAADVGEGGGDLAPAPEIVLAIAMRLLKDPDFHDDMLDWYYEHQDDSEEDAEEE